MRRTLEYLLIFAAFTALCLMVLVIANACGWVR